MSNKRALVTGGSNGFGAYLATRLAHEGWQVTATGRRSPSEVELVPGLEYLQADLADPEAVRTLAARVGQVPDLVVHSATAYTNRDTDDPDFDGVEGTFRVNTLAPYLISQDLLAAKDDARFCAFIVLNSDTIFGADDKSAVYAASKAALRVLTTGLAHTARSRNAAVSTLTLGPLADDKVNEVEAVAEKTNLSVAEVTRKYLRKSNPNLTIDEFISYEACYESVLYMERIGVHANGMVCKLDGGSTGSLV